MKDTHEAEFTRDYKVSVARLWSAVTDPDEVIQWFGPEGVDLIEKFEVDPGAASPEKIGDECLTDADGTAPCE